jgi:hypothetical protein
LHQSFNDRLEFFTRVRHDVIIVDVDVFKQWISIISSAKPKTADEIRFDCFRYCYHFRALVINWKTQILFSSLSSTIAESKFCRTLFRAIASCVADQFKFWKKKIRII